MKKYFLLIALISNLGALAKEPDSVYLFSYATAKNNHHNGLHFAWSRDKLSWYSIGNEFSYLKSDYGRWGSEKRMITPYLIQGAGGEWQCIWSLNEKDKVFAHASSRDLVDWGRQSYPGTKTGMNLLRPTMSYESRSGIYTLMYTDSLGRHYMLTSKDFKTFSPVNDVPSSQYKNLSVTIDLPEGRVTGQLHFVAWEVVDKLIKTAELQQYKNMLYSESAKDDAQRFAGLKPIRATITLQPGKAKSISDKLMGIFFEDINYAADGGLYAELIQNRDFEYEPADKQYRDKNWNSKHSWRLDGTNSEFSIDSIAPIHYNNRHYAVLETNSVGASLVNSGFDGIAIKKGETYHLSLFAKQLRGKNGLLLAKLVNKTGEVLGQTRMNVSSKEWKNVKTV